jgi:capsular polysaccharide biosynthesis protein
VNNLSFYHLVRILTKNILVIILVSLVSGVAAFSYCQYFVEEKFAAIGSVLVTNGAILYEKNDKTNSVQSSDIAASINLLTTVEDILSTNDIYKRLAEELDGQYSYSELKRCATVGKRDDNSLFIDVRFQTSSKSETVKITNTFLELAPAYISKFIPHSATTAVTMADTAVKTAPRTTSATVSAMLIGAIICYAIVYLISLSNVTIESESDFKDRYDIPILGNIPNFSEVDNKTTSKYAYKRG